MFMGMHKLGITALVCALSWGWVWAQPRISVLAKTSSNTIGVNESLVYTVEITSTGGNLPSIVTPQPPQAQGLELIQPTPSTAQSSIFANGRVQQTVGFSWYFRPLREGDGAIGRTAIVIGRETYSTQPIIVHIVSQKKRPQSPSFKSRSLFDDPYTQNPNNNLQPPPATSVNNQDVFIKAVPSATSVFQGEQMFIDYYFYVKRDVEFKNSTQADSWNAEGFWREELEAQPMTELESINGQVYRKVLVKRVAVFPTRAGQLKVDPFKVKGDAGRISSSDPFDSFFGGSMTLQPMVVESPPVVIQSRALPSGAPASFSGSVGRLDMQVSLDKQNVEVGSPVTLTIRITGSANIATLAPPAVNVDAVVEKYEPEVQTHVDRTAQVYGSKTFRFTLIPRENGQHIIQPIEFTYFDLASKSYKTIRTGTFTFMATGSAQALSSGKGAFPARDIAAILPTAEWLSAEGMPLHRQIWPYFVLLLPVLALGGLVFYRKHADRMATDAVYARNRVAQPAAKKHLRDAQSKLSSGDAKAFYDEVSRALQGFVGNRLNIAEKGLRMEELVTRLNEAGVLPDVQQELRALLNEADAVRFAPVTPSFQAMKTALERAENLIQQMDDHFRATRKSGEKA